MLTWAALCHARYWHRLGGYVRALAAAYPTPVPHIASSLQQRTAHHITTVAACTLCQCQRPYSECVERYKGASDLLRREDMRAVCLPDARKTMFHWMCQAAASCTTNSVFNRTKDVSLLLTTDAIVFQAAKDACTGAVSTRGKDVEVANSGVGEKVVLATVKGD
eukprot:3860322-Rhodomonas_salina.1